MREHHIKSTEIEASSLNVAMKRANNFALEQDELQRRFAFERPQWSEIYDVPQSECSNKRKCITRLFKRDVDNTGKVAYIHVSWWLLPEGK